jgi:hypothetical protein
MANGDEVVIRDREAMGEKAEMSHEEIVNLAELSPEEKVIERKLRRRIDSLIMPLVILVYLMNYIDRCVLGKWMGRNGTNSSLIGITTRLQNCRVSQKI